MRVCHRNLSLIWYSAASYGAGRLIKRSLDIVGAIIGLVILSPVLLLVGLAVRLESPGPALHWSSRVGRDNNLFLMPKFRSMRIDAPDVATHLLPDPDRWITPLGRFLRRHSIDEFPQLWSILKGDMSFVGPRPALHSQADLMDLRNQAGVQILRPGLTGWAQVNGRDELPIPEKARLDAEYLAKRSVFLDLWIISRTAITAFSGRGIRH
ncbi:MAG: lipid carrier--UDP-N-acetylgalactosaminyltransferase [Phenylobacterium zucineum]|nr:MAG: lipid carrier--UDP-N-acetylgalactosaminyltransferase [Phenylobacterium zucineum]